MVVDCHLGRLLYLVHQDVSRAQQLLQQHCSHRHVPFGYPHLHLQLVYYVVGDIHDFLEHRNLLLVPNHAHLRAFKEEIPSVPAVDVEVYLGSYFLEQDEIALEDQLHLNFVEKDGLLLVLGSFVLFLGTEVVDLLVELLVLLEVGLELVDGLFGHLVELVLLLLDGGSLCWGGEGFLLARSSDVVVLKVDLVVVGLVPEELAGDLLLLLLEKGEDAIIVLVNWGDRVVRGLQLLPPSLVLQNQHLGVPQPLDLLPLQLALLLLLFGRAPLAEERLLRNRRQRRVKTVYVKSSVAFVAYDQLVVVVLVVLKANLTRHILQPLIPLLSRNVCRL